MVKLFKRKMGKKQKAALNALADGIECGAKLRPQAQGSLLKYIEMVDGTDCYGTCALGAALECRWMQNGTVLNEETEKAFRSTEYDTILSIYGVQNRAMEKRIQVRDVDGNLYSITMDADVSGLIWQLNDKALWTREQIAAFLRECE